MAIKSMTGFGRAELEHEGCLLDVEVRCVNNRFLDAKIKMPKGFAALEERIRKKVAVCHQRGRVDVQINMQGGFSDLQTVTANLELARAYRRALSTVASELEVDDEISLAKLAAYPEILVLEQRAGDIEKIWNILLTVLDAALGNCNVMRLQEGAALECDLRQRLAAFDMNVDKIAQAVPAILAKREASLKERLEKLLGDVELDPIRLSQEVAILADKTDVTEELVRLRSHIDQFMNFLDTGGEVGRKLDFLIQEFLREVNTIGSKISDAGIAHIIVDLKGELEKMREQVQNLE